MLEADVRDGIEGRTERPEVSMLEDVEGEDRILRLADCSVLIFKDGVCAWES